MYRASESTARVPAYPCFATTDLATSGKHQGEVRRRQEVSERRSCDEASEKAGGKRQEVRGRR